MNFNLGALLAVLVAFQFLFVGLYLFAHSKGNKGNNILLGVLFVIFALSLVDFILRVSGVILEIPLLHLLDDGFFLLYGPLIYFYVLGVVFRDFQFKIRDLLHLAPYVTYSAYIIYHLIVIDSKTQIEIAQKVATSDLPAWVFLMSLIIYIHIFSYLWMGWTTLARYQTVIKDKFSSIDQVNLDWLSFMIKAFVFITVVAMVHNTMPVFGNVIFHYSSLILLLIASFYFINRVLVKALNQPSIFSGIELKETKKYAASKIDQNSVDAYKLQLKTLMDEEKMYLNPELTSGELAARLDISTKTLSQVINQGFKMNFFDFINTYRCEEVKRILKGEDKKITVLEAMYDAGFNSKSSFNKEFKKLTGQTPSEFKRS